MKKLALTLFAVLASVAVAGDDYIATVAYTGTAACSSALKPKTKYAVRCTTACHVRVTSDTTNATATTNSMKLAADTLYDTPTTGAQVYICAIQSASGGNMLIYQNRGPNE